MDYLLFLGRKEQKRAVFFVYLWGKLIGYDERDEVFRGEAMAGGDAAGRVRCDECGRC